VSEPVPSRSMSASTAPKQARGRVMAFVGGRRARSRPRFRWMEAYRLARIRRSTIRLEEEQAARQLLSKRCVDFYHRVAGRHVVSEVRAPCSHAAHDDLRRTCMRWGFQWMKGSFVWSQRRNIRYVH
jgi:hypothetical protein